MRPVCDRRSVRRVRRRAIGLALSLIVWGCTGGTWPGRAFDIPVDQPTDAQRVLMSVKQALLPIGYVEQESGGYDAIRGSRTSVSLRNGDKIVMVSFATKSHVEVRISHRRSVANDNFEQDCQALRAALVRSSLAVREIP